MIPGPRELRKPVGAQAPNSHNNGPQFSKNLPFIAFPHYDFQNPMGARAPTAPMIAGPLNDTNFTLVYQILKILILEAFNVVLI